MSLVRSLTVILLASVSFNMVTFSSYSMEELDGKAVKSSVLKTQSALQEVESKKKKSKKTGATVQPSGLVDDQEEDESAVPAPARKVIDDEAVTLDRDGAVDDKREEQTSPVAVGIVSALTSSTPVPDSEKKEEKDKSGQTPASSGEGDTHLSDDEAELLNAPTPPAEKEEEKPSASSAAATSKPYQALMDEMLSGQAAYSAGRQEAALKTFPAELYLNPFSPQSILEFNTLFCLVADNFHVYGTPESLLAVRQERVIAWFHARIAEKQEQKSKFESDLVSQEGGILKGVEPTIISLKTDIENYNLRLSESLDDMARIDKFRGFTITAIETTEATRNQYQEMKDKETNASKRTEYQTKIIEFEENIAKFREQLRIVETLFHAKYPFHREGAYFLGIIPYDALKAKISRFGRTGTVSLSSLTFPKLKLEDRVSDDSGHFTALMRYFLGKSDLTPIFNDAIKVKRIALLNTDASS